MFSEKPETIAVYNALIRSLKYHGQCFTGTKSHFRVNDTGHNALVITRLRETGKYRNGKTMHCKTARRCTKKSQTAYCAVCGGTGCMAITGTNRTRCGKTIGDAVKRTDLSRKLRTRTILIYCFYIFSCIKRR